MMSRIFFIALTLFFSLPAYAADAGPHIQIPAGGTLRGHFTEEHEFKSGKKPLHSTGTFLVAPGYGVIWNIESPLPITVIVTPAGMTQSIGTMRLPSVSASKLPILSHATSMLSDALMGKWQGLEKDFTVTRSTIPTGGWLALLQARPEAKLPVQSITVQGTQFVDNAMAVRPDGGTENFTFSGQAVSPSPITAAESAAFSTANTPQP